MSPHNEGTIYADDNNCSNNDQQQQQNGGEKQQQEEQDCCQTCTQRINNTLENSFQSIGFKVASYPKSVITISVIICCLCIIGVVEYYAENRGEKLWVPSDSISLEHQNWVTARYPAQSRIINVLLEGDILTPKGLKAMVDYDKKLKELNTGEETAWENICLDLSSNPAQVVCQPSTLLAVWEENATHILSLSQQQILQDLNEPILTNKFDQPIVLDLLLGGIGRSSAGDIKSAMATKMTYFLKNQEVFKESAGRRVDDNGTAWEESFVKKMDDSPPPDGYSLFYYSRTSQQEDAGSAISGDLAFLGIGYVLIIIYLAAMLGTFSRINQKLWLAIIGVACIGLSIGVSYGLSSAFQLFVSPVHSILPFLLLGIGVDDIFVIVQSWDNIKGPSRKGSMPEDIGKAIRHAGVSILVTSVTDICAFLIGATTILPALRSFCIFAGIGIMAIFLLTMTIFVGALALDTKRQRGRRDACCCCIRLSDDWQPMGCSEKNILQTFISTTYCNIILSIPGKIGVLLVTVGLLTGGAVGLSQLRQDFDFNWFLPPGTMTVYYNEKIDLYFSNAGVRSAIYTGEVDYFAEQTKLREQYDIARANKYITNSTVKSWYVNFVSWVKLTKPSNIENSAIKTEVDFLPLLKSFLTQKQGSPFAKDIKWNKDRSAIIASRINFDHTQLEDASTEIKAMDSLQNSLQEKDRKMDSKNAEDFDTAFAYTRFYVSWETNKVISTELARNLVLAGVIVFLVTLFLIANLWTSLMVVTCVVFTLIDIAGFMHFWGLTIDTVTTIQLILAIGLSVDYSAHIGHAFMTVSDPCRTNRARAALTEIGPAVFHGGFSTFLAFVFLAGSKSYVFSVFFKVFFLVVVFGLFHGLVYLPVLLSLIGPPSYSRPQPSSNEQEMKVQPTETYVKVKDPNHAQQGHPSNNQPKSSVSSLNEAYEADNST